VLPQPVSRELTFKTTAFAGSGSTRLRLAPIQPRLTLVAAPGRLKPCFLLFFFNSIIDYEVFTSDLK
jgi:hypothetical protein